MATVTVDGRTSQVSIGTTILDAARQTGIAIPTLCHYRGLTPTGACRVCLVEVEMGESLRMVSSCSYPIEETLVVHTGGEAVLEARRTVVELMLAQAPDSQELKDFAAELGVESTSFAVAEEGKCVLCGLCTRVCNDVMGRGAINLYGRSSDRQVAPAYDETTAQCQNCGACEYVCPTGAINLAKISPDLSVAHRTGYDQRLFKRPNIEMAHAQAAPRVPTIDRDNCVHFKTGECGLCEKVCQAGAIDYEQEEEILDLEVGAVVLTPGFKAFDATTRRSEFGLGFCDNVVSNVQFETLLSASGPTSGHIRRPSDGIAPKRIAFIQCIGSRDVGCGNEYCSSVCCMAATKEAIVALDHEPELDITIFFLDMRAFGKDFDRYYQRAQDSGVRYVRSFISRIFEMPDTRNLQLAHMDSEMNRVEEEFDMVVLSLALEPGPSLRQQAEMMNVDLNTWGFAKTTDLCPLDTSRPGVFVGGVFHEPKDIPDTVMQSSGSAARAMALLASARNSRVRTKTYPPQRDVTDEPPRVGVFVCHCGSNIASVVDVAAVVAKTRELPYVALAESNTYTCADDTQDHMKEMIIEYHLNRVIVASCTPRTHEAIFRDTLKDAGLNPYLLEMTNIRDQCSWVHSGEPEAATEKAMQLVRMTLGRAVGLRPIQEQTVPVKNGALIIGGGLAGLTAAAAIAEQGFPVCLVEKDDALGGAARKIDRVLDGGDLQAHLNCLIEKVTAHPRIAVHKLARVTKVDGHIGDFECTIEVDGADTVTVENGAVVVATGAVEHKPDSYNYLESEKVITQSELSEKLGREDVDLPADGTVAMIQCVEQRDEQRPYCSRVCCTMAVKNALALKEKQPDLNVVVFYRDMRTYGFREAAYQEAREKGVLFVRYEQSDPPSLTGLNGSMNLTAFDRSLQRNFEIEPDVVVLAVPIVAREDRQDISDLLKVPLNADGFYLEAHVKLRPVDFASEGLFLCGTAHAPKFVGETISQANAVAGRVASILSKEEMPVSGQIAFVDTDRCISCMTCVHLCPYNAPEVGTDNKANIQSVVCMGCGSCASGCPARAITLRNYTNDQITGAIRSLLWSDAPAEQLDPVCPEGAGIAQTRWHRTQVSRTGEQGG